MYKKMLIVYRFINIYIYNPCLHRSVQEKKRFNYSELSGLTDGYNKKYQYTVDHI